MVEIKEINGGVKIGLEKISHVESVSVGIWVRTGAVNEEKDNGGISHFIEHMMFKGTEKRSPKELAEGIDKIGGNINAFTGKEATCYYIKTLSSNLEKGLDILLDMFSNSLFLQEELTRERKVIFEEIKMINDAPDEVGHDMISETIFRGNPIGNRIIGSRSSLNKINSDIMKDYVKNQYTKDSMVVCVVGNFNKEKVIDQIEQGLGKMKAKKKERKYTLSGYEPKYVSKSKEIEQSHIFLGIPTVKLSSDDYYPITTLSSILGGSMSSRLFQNIREQKGLAYSVYSGNSSYRHAGYFQIYAGVSHNTIGGTASAIRAELDILKSEGITKEELYKAKEQLKSNYIFGLESIDRRMYSMGRNLLLLNTVEEPKKVVKEIDAVNIDQIEKAIKTITNIENYSGVLITNGKNNLKEFLG